MTLKLMRGTILLAVLICLLINFGAVAVFAGVSPAISTRQSVEDLPFPAPNITPAQPSSGFAWGSFFLTVFLFIVLLVGLSLLVKRLNRTPALTGPWLKVLDKQQLGPGHYVYLVELAGKLQILGVTGHSMVKITEIDDIEMAGEILQDLSWRSEQALPPWWSQILDRIKERSFFDELSRFRKEEKQ